VALLRQRGHEVLAASPDSGVNTLTGEGLREALAGAQVVVDVANSPSFDDTAVMKFFQTSGKNLLAAEAAAGVRHHVALSIVGADRLPDSGYLRAKVVQENLIKASGVPYPLSVKNDKRKVVADVRARYFGTELGEESLIPAGTARIGQTRFEAWIGHSSASH
jgi:uncharacterized protein YbjT (DUF2867 family)